MFIEGVFAPIPLCRACAWPGARRPATRAHTPDARHQPRALRPYCPVTAVRLLSTAASGQAGRGVALPPDPDLR